MSLYTLNYTIQMGQLQKLTKLLQNFEKVKAEIVDGIGEIAVTEFVLNFRKQSFNSKAWQPKKKPNGKNILIGRGSLRRSIKVTKKTSDTVTIGSDIPYAYIHNNGGKGKAFGKYSFIMPQRKFMGDMPSLTKKLTAFIKRKFKNIDK